MNECSKTQIENQENLRCSTNEAEHFREGVSHNMKKATEPCCKIILDDLGKVTAKG